jgi:hypothetical protein
MLEVLFIMGLSLIVLTVFNPMFWLALLFLVISRKG